MNGLAIFTLWQRELQRFFRQPSRIAGAVGSPLLFWILIGSGLSSSFRLPTATNGAAGAGLSYLEYFFPGVIVLVILFASIFTTISVIEDRNEGFLQGVLVAPIGRGALVAGKVLGGASIAWLQGVAFLALAPFSGISLTVAGVLQAVAVLAVLAFTLTAIGFGFAWKVGSVQGFHAVMNLLLVPLWLLSGAFFPATGAPLWLRAVMRANPLTYGVAGLREALYSGLGAGSGAAAAGLPGGLPAVAVTLLLAAAAFGFALFVTRGGRVD
jgi:ABC-2 type transport system permease protein